MEDKPPSTSPLTYRDAGVDIEKADALVDEIRGLARGTRRPGVLDDIGGFASLFSLLSSGAGAMRDPVLVSGTDGVGTKLEIAFATGIHDTVGIDLVAMCVNDVLTTGATPLFFLDYFATGRLDVAVARDVIAGIARGCREAGCALVGGETAELPGLYRDGTYDLAGFAVGVVDRARIVDGKRVVPGDCVIGVRSRGLHSNGFSLARAALFDRGRLSLDAELPGIEGSLGRALLAPTPIYAKTVCALSSVADVKALAHITGGGIAGNVPRVLPDGTVAEIDRGRFLEPAIFGHIARLGDVPEDEMLRTFNMGLGLVAVVPKSDVVRAIEAVNASGESAVEIGSIVAAHVPDAPAEVRFVRTAPVAPSPPIAGRTS